MEHHYIAKPKRNYPENRTVGLKHEPKLTWEVVNTIRREYNYHSRRQGLKHFAKRYGVSVNTIHKVVINETWKCNEYAKVMVNHPITDKRYFKHYFESRLRMEALRASLQSTISDEQAVDDIIRDVFA